MTHRRRELLRVCGALQIWQTNDLMGFLPGSSTERLVTCRAVLLVTLATSDWTKTMYAKPLVDASIDRKEQSM